MRSINECNLLLVRAKVGIRMRKEMEAQAKLSQPVMQALIKVSAPEKALLEKGILTDNELASALAHVVSDLAKTAKEELGVVIDFDQD